MFDLCDWNDSSDAPSLPQSLVSAQGEGAHKEKVVSSRKKRLKRTRQLIEILRSLETPHLQESKDSESPPDVIIKRKPKRAEVQEPRLNKNVQPTNNEVQPTAVGSHLAPADIGPRLSRQQWRNKQKNKKKNKNKFKQLMDPVVQKNGTVKGKVVDEGRKEEVAGLEKGESKHLDGATTSAIRTEGKSTAKEAAVWSKGSKNNGKLSEGLSGKERQRLQKIKKILERGKEDKSHIDQKEETELPTDCVEEAAMEDKSSLLRSRMEERLSSGRFRFLNQQLYTSHSHEALRLFQDDPEAFMVYHNGFSRQVQHWPVNPVTEILKYIKNRPPRLVVADFGCGDALIARSVRNEVHSFDLVALNDHVTVCDMAEVPLSDETVDIVVFCLSLMGKNLGDFLREANRVLKMGGVLLVAEVSSRFSDIRQFLNAMSLLGFKNVAKNTDNSYFYIFEFNKTSLGKDCSKHPGLQLTACLYKKR